MAKTHLEQIEYEKGWASCVRCGCIRPMRQLGRELELGLTVLVCLDSGWCERIRHDRHQRQKLEALGKHCLAVPDCPKPREKGKQYCSTHARKLRGG